MSFWGRMVDSDRSDRVTMGHATGLWTTNSISVRQSQCVVLSFTCRTLQIKYSFCFHVRFLKNRRIFSGVSQVWRSASGGFDWRSNVCSEAEAILG